MSRYNGSNGSNDSDNDYEDDITLKIKPYSTVRFTPIEANGSSHDQYGASFITNYEDAEVLDGIVLRRDDKPKTWNVYSADKFFHLNPEDGRVYENVSEDDGYTNEMSAQDILDHPRVQGHSTSAGGNDYFFTPVGAVIEEAGDIAMNDDVDVETSDEPSIVAGGASTLLSNNSWTRVFTKKMTEEGNAVIEDNGKDPTPRGEDDVNPKYNNHKWLATTNPTLREELEGRTLELWVTQTTQNWDDGEETTYPEPNLMDVKTDEFVTIDNGVDESDDTESSEQAKATDGGTMAQDESDTTDTESTESTVDVGLPEDVPDKLDDLISYMARNEDDPDAADIRDFAEDEVENPDEIDWDAAAEEARNRT